MAKFKIGDVCEITSDSDTNAKGQKVVILVEKDRDGDYLCTRVDIYNEKDHPYADIYVHELDLKLLQTSKTAVQKNNRTKKGNVQRF